MSTSIGAETSIKIIAAVHSQCRRWVNHCISIEPQSRPLSVVAPIADKRGQTRWCLVCLQSARSRLHRLDRNATKKLAHLARRRSRVHAPTTFRLNECPSRPRNEVKRWLKRQALGFGFCILFLEFVWEMCGSREKNLSGVPSYYAALPPCTGPVFRIRPKSNRQYAPNAFIPAHAIP
jgi:hypothetical protein